MKTIAALVLVLLLASPLAAQVRYKDDEGVMHWVNSLDEVPDKYRSRAAGQPVQPTSPSQPGQPPTSQPVVQPSLPVRPSNPGFTPTIINPSR